MNTPQPLRIGIVGLGWMGQVHARSLTRLRQHYPLLALAPQLVAVADNAADERLAAAVDAYGFRDVHADWRDLVARDDLAVVCITGPNAIHRDVAVAAAAAGKHIWIEKPAGRTAAEAREIQAAVHRAGVCSAVGFNYRNAPAVERARGLVADGSLGRVEHVGVTMLADYAAEPSGALTWRYRNADAGSGVLGDLVSHGVDLARYVVGDISELVADIGTFITHRPTLSGTAFAHTARGTGPLSPVENEDYASAILRFAGGARGTLESSRVAVGEQCNYGFTIHGDRGALGWDFRRPGELRVCLDQDVTNASYRTEFVTPSAGEFGAFQPGAGIAMSFDDLKVIEAHRLVRSIADGTTYGATIDDAVVAAEIVEAMAASAASRSWVTLRDRGDG